MAGKRKKVRRIIVEDLDRAIVLDFEGFIDQAPSLACVLVDGTADVIVFDERLRLAAMAKGLVVLSLDVFLRELVTRLRAEDRKLLAFSSREAGVFKDILGVDVITDGLYLDGLPHLRAWRNSCFPELAARLDRARKRACRRGRFFERKGNRLIDLCTVAGIKPPPSYGKGRTTARMAAVMSQLERHGCFERLTPTAKGKWTNVLTHVTWDCEGLLEACRVAAAG